MMFYLDAIDHMSLLVSRPAKKSWHHKEVLKIENSRSKINDGIYSRRDTLSRSNMDGRHEYTSKPTFASRRRVRSNVDSVCVGLC
jgi:hypothetical protein